MRIGVPKETAEGERRVALVPDVVRRLAAGGHSVVLESGAGAAAGLPDSLFTDAGAELGDPYARRRGRAVAPSPPDEAAAAASTC